MNCDFSVGDNVRLVYPLSIEQSPYRGKTGVVFSFYAGQLGMWVRFRDGKEFSVSGCQLEYAERTQGDAAV
jgi:hypothetical protein